MKELFGIASVIVSFVAVAPYIWGIYKRTNKPHMFSWIIWGFVSAVVGYIQVIEDGGAGSWLLIFNTVFSIGIAISAYWLGTKDIKRIDWIVLFAALFSIPLWVFTKNPLWSVILVVSIDAMGYIPTIRKSWLKPYDEAALMWAMSIVVFTLSFLALENYTLTTYLYPITFAIINFFFVAYLLVRRRNVNA